MPPDSGVHRVIPTSDVALTPHAANNKLDVLLGKKRQTAYADAAGAVGNCQKGTLSKNVAACRAAIVLVMHALGFTGDPAEQQAARDMLNGQG